MKTNKMLALVLCLALAMFPLTALAEESPYETLKGALNECGLDITPYEGKAIYLNFFTGWCGYCMEEMPDIKKAYEQYSSDELQIILVHVWDGEDQKTTDQVRKTYGLDELTFHEDEKLLLATAVQLQGYPAHLFINADGTPHAGFNYVLNYEQITEQLDAMGISKALK